jgi:hypothetical protein
LTAVFSISVRCGSSSPVSGLVVLFSSHVSITSLQAMCQCCVTWHSDDDSRDTHASRQQLAHVSVHVAEHPQALTVRRYDRPAALQENVKQKIGNEMCNRRITAYRGTGMSTTGCNPCKGLTAATTGSLSSSDADTSESQMIAVINGMWLATHGDPQQRLPPRRARSRMKTSALTYLESQGRRTSQAPARSQCRLAGECL